MTQTIIFVFVKATGHILGAVTRNDSAPAVTPADLVGAGMQVRNPPGPLPPLSAGLPPILSIHPNYLDTSSMDLDANGVNAMVLLRPWQYAMSTAGTPAPLPDQSGLSITTLTPTASSLTVDLNDASHRARTAWLQIQEVGSTAAPQVFLEELSATTSPTKGKVTFTGLNLGPGHTYNFLVLVDGLPWYFPNPAGLPNPFQQTV